MTRVVQRRRPVLWVGGQTRGPHEQIPGALGVPLGGLSRESGECIRRGLIAPYTARRPMLRTLFAMTWLGHPSATTRCTTRRAAGDIAVAIAERTDGSTNSTC